MADAMDAVLRDPRRNTREFERTARALGPPDALERCARFAVALAQSRAARPGLRHDSHLSHLGSARPARNRAALASVARARSPDCSSIAATRCAEVKPCIVATSRSSPKSTRPVTTRRRSAIASFTISFAAASARVATHAPPARLHESRRYEGSRRCRSSRSLTIDTRRRAAFTCSDCSIMQYPVGSPWERIFGWRFLDPWDAVEPYARGGARRRHAGRALARRPSSRSRSWRERRAAHRSAARRPQPRHALRPGVRRRRADRSRRTVRTLRFASELEYNAARARFELSGFRLVPLLAAA